MSELRIQNISFADGAMKVAFADGQGISVSLGSFSRLQTATPEQLSGWQLIGRGLGVHWEEIDEDLSVENILTAYSRAKTGEYAAAHGG
jgi:hypothetical protein